MYYQKRQVFLQNLIEIALKSGLDIGQSKRHYLVLKIITASSKNHFLFITFFDLHLIVDIN